MWRRRILFHALDIDWTPPLLMMALGGVGLVCGGVLIAYILKRVGKQRALTEDELSTLGRSPDPNQVRMKWSGAKGTRIEASVSISALRAAANRGDWALFWAWPCCMMTWGIGAALLFFGLFTLDPDTPTVIYVVLGVFFAAFLALPPFMVWAALFTDIEKDVAEPEASASANER